MSDVPDTNAPLLRVLITASGVIPSTHIRLISPFDWLAEREMLQVGMVLEQDLTPDMFDWADVLVMQRSTSEGALRLVRRFHSQGKPVIYECDDNFLAITPDTPAVGQYYSNPEVKVRFTQILSEAAIVSVSTPALEREFKRFNRNVRLLPNCVDTSFFAPTPRVPNADRVVLGYAGTVTHGPDFNEVEPVLRRLLNEYGDRLGMQFFGFVPQGFEKYDTVSFVPYKEDYPGFLNTLSQVDWSFGIAPLVNRPFNRYKTNNKYREYGACGIPGVYSEGLVYADSVRDGVTGLITPHTQQGWYKTLKRMIDEPATRESIAHSALADVSARYSVETSARAWLDLLLEATGRSEGA